MATTKTYRVTLTALEREELAALLGRGKADVRKLKHAQVLLHADKGRAADGAGSGPGWCYTRIAEAGLATVQRVRQRFVEDGFAAALRTYRTGGRVYERKLDGAQEAHLVSWLAAPRRRDGRAGCCGCWPAGWSSCSTPVRCRTRPCGGCLND